jgi:hypothetical protein
VLVSLVLIPLIGALSDRIGRKPILLAATGGLFVLAWPLFWMLHHPEIALVLPAQIGFAGFGCLLRRHCSSSNGRVGARPGPVHRTVRGQQHRNGVSWRLNPAGRGLHHQAQSIRPLPDLPADGSGGDLLVVVVGLRETYKLALSSPTAVADAA